MKKIKASGKWNLSEVPLLALRSSLFVISMIFGLAASSPAWAQSDWDYEDDDGDSIANVDDPAPWDSTIPNSYGSTDSDTNSSTDTSYDYGTVDTANDVFDDSYYNSETYYGDIPMDYPETYDIPYGENESALDEFDLESQTEPTNENDSYLIDLDQDGRDDLYGFWIGTYEGRILERFIPGYVAPASETSENSGMWNMSRGGGWPDGGTDQDGDFLSDNFEKANSTLDYVWVETAPGAGTFEFIETGLNFEQRDSDFDHIPDGVEVLYLDRLARRMRMERFNPLDRSDGLGNPDLDDYQNWEEILRGTDPLTPDDKDFDEVDEPVSAANTTGSGFVTTAAAVGGGYSADDGIIPGMTRLKDGTSSNLYGNGDYPQGLPNDGVTALPITAKPNFYMEYRGGSAVWHRRKELWPGASNEGLEPTFSNEYALGQSWKENGLSDYFEGGGADGKILGALSGYLRSGGFIRTTGIPAVWSGSESYFPYSSLPDVDVFFDTYVSQIRFRSDIPVKKEQVFLFKVNEASAVLGTSLPPFVSNSILSVTFSPGATTGAVQLSPHQFIKLEGPVISFACETSAGVYNRAGISHLPLPVEIVQGELGTEDEDVGNWLMAEADPKPEVEMSITDAQLSRDSLTISVQGTVKDVLSKYADNGSERVSSLRFVVDGAIIHSISLSDAVADGQAFNETVTISNVLPRGYTLRAETSENRAGNIGWDHVAVGLTLQNNQTGGSGANITLSFSNPPTSGAADTVSVSGVGGSGTLTETAASSGEYTGTINGESVSAFIGSAENLSDTLAEQIVAKVVFGGSAVHGTFEETGAKTLTFESTGYQGGGDSLTVGASVDLPGSQKEEFKPITFRVQRPDNWAEFDDVKVKIGNTEYQLKEFSIGGTTALYPFDDQFPDEPKQFLPSKNPVPRKLEVPQYSPGGGELPIKLIAGGSENDITSIQVERGTHTFADANASSGGHSAAGSSAQIWKSGDKVTEEQLLDAYEWIYGGDEMAMTLLEAFLDDDNIIRLKETIGDLDVNGLRIDQKIEIEIENDGKGINPITCANLLYAGLYRALAYPPLNGHADVVDNWQLFEASRQAWARTAAEITATGAEMYLSGIGIVLEPVDWVLVVNDVAEGQVTSLAAALPFVPVSVVKGGRRMVFNTPDGEFLGDIADQAQLNAIQIASRKRVFNDKIAVLEEAGVDDGLIILLVRGGEIQYAKAHKTLKDRMRRAGRPKPRGNFEAQHDLPWEFRREFAESKIDVNDEQFGRWVHRDDHARWHNEEPKFNDVWEEFFYEDPGVQQRRIYRTKDEILKKLQEVRSSYTRTITE